MTLVDSQADLEKAAEQVNSVETEEGMLSALTIGVGSNCKCLTLFTAGHPLKPQEEEPEGLTYAVRQELHTRATSIYCCMARTYGEAVLAVELGLGITWM